MMQPRFERRTGSSPLTLVEQMRFRAGFDFLRLRAQNGEVDAELAQWWEAFSTAEHEVRLDMLAQIKAAQQKSSPRRRGAAQAEGMAEDGDEPAPPAAIAPKKRRRRRSKPKTEGGAPRDAAGPDRST